MRSKVKAMTLIELLIVVAIMAIICTSSMMVFTAPLHEMVSAQEDRDFESGAALFFSQFAWDVHCSRAFSASNLASTTGTVEMSQLMLDSISSSSARIEYDLTADHRITRKSGDHAAVSLMSNIAHVKVTHESTTGPLWQIQLEALPWRMDSAAICKTRTLVVCAGSAWQGAD